MQLLMLAMVGGALGTGLRYLVNVGVARTLPAAPPVATLLVNIVGSLAMGLVISLVASRLGGSTAARTFLATGILGGFTTFSAFSLDFHYLAESDRVGLAITYVAVSVVASLAAIYAGFYLGKAIG